MTVAGMILDKMIKNESCTLEYIRDNIEQELEGLKVVGEKGEPLEAIYVEYKGYEYEIDDQYIVSYVGEGGYKEKVDLELTLDRIETGVEEVEITAKASILEGKIEEIERPDGTKEKGEETKYIVKENGEYTFKARTDRGRIAEKTIKISNIKEEGIDLTGLSTGEDIHNHIYETKYDETNHWQECIICGNKKEISKHNIKISGNSATCDVYVQLGKEICTDNCGYSKQIERLPHIRPEKLEWVDYNGAFHLACQCERCGGSGSNGLKEYHNFNINGKTMTVPQMLSEGLNVHEYNVQRCTECDLDIDLSKHYFYATTCSLCGVNYGPSMNINIPENNIKNGKIQLNFLENDTQYIYIDVDTKGLECAAVSSQPKGYTGGNPEIIEKQGNIWKYKIALSKDDNSKNFIENIYYRFVWDTTLKSGTELDGYQIGKGRVNGELVTYIVPVDTAPTITSIEEINEETSGEWVVKKKLKIKGTCDKREIVYISMYDEEGKALFENSGCEVINGNYEYIANYGIEATEERKFTIKVKDMFENEETREITLKNVDSQAPKLVSETNYSGEWSKVKIVEIIAEEKGIGQVEIGFNKEEYYQKAEEKEGKYKRNYRFVGDVYKEMQGVIYLKDGLGNTRTERITIGKLDNTSPTITNIEQIKEENGTKIKITANDINDKIKEEGSGIAGYVITQSKEIPTDSAYGKSNEIKVNKPGTYYIYVKDNVGNYAQRKEIIVE